MEFRIGVNVGDVIVEGDDIHGDGVNVAARVQQLATPGGLCLSGAAREQIAGKLPYVFDDAGEQAVKNIARPVHLFRLRRDRGASAMPLPLASKLSIAVLPFANMSGDPEQEYFSDGISEDIITELSRFRELLVIARNSSFVFKGHSVDVVEVGRKLGVAYVVEGSVRKAGNRVRVSAQLVETATGSHLWAERYDRDLADIFAVQDELVRAIAAVVPGELHRTRYDRARQLSPEQLTAHDYVLRGRWALWRSGSYGDTLIANYLKALELDPQCVAAHVELSQVYGYGIFRLGLPWDATLLKAKHHVAAALAIDDSDAKTQASAALTYIYCGEYDLARFHSERAIALNPNDIFAIAATGVVLSYTGQAAAGLEHYKVLERLHRFDPQEVGLEALFDCYYMLGDDEKAIEAFRRMQNPVPHMWVEYGAALANLGRVDEARAAVAAGLRDAPPGWDAPNFARNHPRMCQRREDAERWLDGYRKAGVEV
jgi:adenylate cyclase